MSDTTANSPAPGPRKTASGTPKATKRPPATKRPSPERRPPPPVDTSANGRPQITDDTGQIQNVGLDQLLAEATSVQHRFIPGAEALKAAALLARRPRNLARHTATAATELLQVAAGRSPRTPPRGDARFRDPACQNWLFRRLCQGYLSIGEYLRTLVDTAGLDWAERERLRLVVDNLIDAAAPTNFPLTNPTVLKTTIDRGGLNFVHGARAAVRDARSPIKLPASVDPTPFKVGQTLAASPGAVVRREERLLSVAVDDDHSVGVRH